MWWGMGAWLRVGCAEGGTVGVAGSEIQNGTFYRSHPSSSNTSNQKKETSQTNPPLFPNLTFNLPSSSTPTQNWAILSPSSTIRTTFLQLLRGQFLCFPPTARSYPYLLTPAITSKNPKLRSPSRAIEYVGFDVERRAFGGAYLSARYESRVEETDFSLAQYLTGIMGMNPGEAELKEKSIEPEVMRRVLADLELERFVERPVSLLSNGQSRRARIAKAVLGEPEVLCLDAPFIGLDPFVTQHISKVLHKLTEANAPRIVLSLRPQDVIPEWITHIVYAGEDGKVQALGPKEEVFDYLQKEYAEIEKDITSKKGNEHELDPKLVELREVGRHLSERGDFETAPSIPSSHPDNSPSIVSRDGYEKHDKSAPAKIGSPVVEMEGVNIQYGTNSVLGAWEQTTPEGVSKPGFWWTVRQGERWGIFGANGSGKTTLLSLVTSDHPQTYSAPVKIFQRSRLPEPGVPGITIFDIQSRVGHASPEVHALFPKYVSVRRTLESAWADTPIAKPKLESDSPKRVDACLAWFEAELNPLYDNENISETSDSSLEWATTTTFSDLSFSAQRVLLFLRATIRNAPIVILDEAFSGMDDLVRDKCLLFLSHGQKLMLHYTDTGLRPVPSETSRQGAVVLEGLRDEQALLCVSHSRSEIPGCVREWVRLPEQGTGTPSFGRWDGPVELDGGRWREVWEGGKVFEVFRNMTKGYRTERCK
ncbi:P-loop containing nucleoside triphosphate hydrolase protein [Periconia macrospinosa]|uniref:P-loop containing nucleoside triphosphate hydrolase protein n=1 Tax=Periconia macrospinosa TaxID=97972 RepID=A0A2V1DVY3_9PLEO|nr:P-loop containing nucleoside triphosphate hydrolase protein [Periconia macrospinosa]